MPHTSDKFEALDFILKSTYTLPDQLETYHRTHPRKISLSEIFEEYALMMAYNSRLLLSVPGCRRRGI